MDDQNLKDLEREQADNKLIGDAFQHYSTPTSVRDTARR